jgi:hypothetical protein
MAHRNIGALIEKQITTGFSCIRNAVHVLYQVEYIRSEGGKICTRIELAHYLSEKYVTLGLTLIHLYSECLGLIYVIVQILFHRIECELETAAHTVEVFQDELIYLFLFSKWHIGYLLYT